MTALGVAAPRTSRRGWLRLVVATGVIGVLAARFGAGPFLDAFQRVDPWAFFAAAGVAAGSSVCCAYRWCAVAAGLGVPVRFAHAVPAYLRSQFLNATLPGGVVGDVHRGLRQHRDGQPLARSLRAVAWERLLGQVIQVLLTVAVLAVIPSHLRNQIPLGAGLAVLAGLGTAMVLAVVVRGRWGLGGRAGRIIAADWRAIRAVPRALPVIAVTSAVAVVGHVVVFLLAAHSVNPDLAVTTLIPVALLVLLIGSLPLNVAGWGPREGAAAWVFGLAGLGAAQGLSVSVLYGVLALLGTLPGALVLLVQKRRG